MKLFNRLLAAYSTTSAHPEDLPRRIFASAILALGIPLILVFSVQDAVQGSYIELTVELVVLAALTVQLYLIRKNSEPVWPYRIAVALIAMFLVFIILNLDGSPEKLNWLFMFPAASFFVLGKNEGLYWNGLFYLLICVVVIFNVQRYFDPVFRYTTSSKIRFCASYLVVAASSYTYVAVQREFAKRILRERSVLRKQKESMQRVNNQIRLMSITDSLTGAFNRRYMHERLGKEMIRARRYSRPLAIVMCDIDHFKNINDSLGHLAGDRILVAFVKCVHETIRSEIDWVARYGGEEFLIVLPETDGKGAGIVAERIRQTLASKAFQENGSEISITASFGVANWQEDDAAAGNIETFINLADGRMYDAKNHGRNQVVVE